MDALPILTLPEVLIVILLLILALVNNNNGCADCVPNPP